MKQKINLLTKAKAKLNKMNEEKLKQNSKQSQKTKRIGYFNAVKFKITDETLINHLNHIHDIFLQERDLIDQANIQPNCFTKDELLHRFRGHFTKKLAELIDKNYLDWELNNKAKYFRMFSLHLRQDFKSLDYKQKITNVLAKYNFDISNKENNDKIREELKELDLYPTKQEINNICRCYKNKSESNTNTNTDEDLKLHLHSIPLDFTLGQDKQTIIQPDLKQPVFHINFNGNWIWLNFTEKLNRPALKYFKNKIDSDKFVRFAKPKFVFNYDENCWFVIITIESEVKVEIKEELENDWLVYRLAGVDIGQVKPYSCVVMSHMLPKNLTKEVVALEEAAALEKFSEAISKNTVSLLRSCEITCKNETRDVNNKLNRVKSHLSDIYRKLNVYSGIIANNKNSQFTQQILEKRELLIIQKRGLRRKRKELQKRKSYLAVRDLLKQLNFYNVKQVNIERLNWVEHTGGSWDFSQQQEILERKAIEFGINVTKVYAANTSKENPFSPIDSKQKKILGVINSKTRLVRFKKKQRHRSYEIDRDILGAINIGLRVKLKMKCEAKSKAESESETKIKDESKSEAVNLKMRLDFNENKKILNKILIKNY